MSADLQARVERLRRAVGTLVGVETATTVEIGCGDRCYVVTVHAGTIPLAGRACGSILDALDAAEDMAREEIAARRTATERGIADARERLDAAAALLFPPQSCPDAAPAVPSGHGP